jgi:hypothetical protein
MSGARGPEGQELRPVVDEIEAEQEELAKAKRDAEKGVDWDRLCAYRTFKVVRIKDRQLGFCYWGIVSCVILYVVVFGFSIEGKHQQQEPGVGTVLTKVIGKAYSGAGSSNIKVFDPSDLRFPVIEPSGAFLLTRKISVTQKRGSCIDWDEPKKCPCDEAAGETCDGDYCKMPNVWCPSLGDKNVDNPPAEAVVDELQGLENIVLKIMSGIAFPGLGNRFFVTGGSPGASNQFKNITLKNLLKLADPPQKLDTKLLNSGALIGVSFFWNCDVAYECEPSVVIKRLDSGQGFVQKRARHYRQGAEELREANYLNGLRILVDSSGIGRKDSLVLAIIMVGSAIALIRVAGIVADNFMLYSVTYSSTRRDAYYKCKVKETSDYSDLQDRINLIHNTKAREGIARPTGGKASGKAGAHVALGLGAGGRGGDAKTILRGR